MQKSKTVEMMLQHYVGLQDAGDEQEFYEKRKVATSVRLNPEIVDRLDRLIEFYQKHGVTVSRTELMKDAIEAFSFDLCVELGLEAWIIKKEAA